MKVAINVYHIEIYRARGHHLQSILKQHSKTTAIHNEICMQAIMSRVYNVKCIFMDIQKRHVHTW